jgi:hypothetical protein
MHFAELERIAQARGWSVIKRRADDDYSDVAPYILSDEQGCMYSTPDHPGEWWSLNEVVEILDKVEPLEEDEIVALRAAGHPNL